MNPLAEAVKALGSAPCDDCIYRPRCASTTQVCRAFSRWVVDGVWPRPDSLVRAPIKGSSLRVWYAPNLGSK